MKNASIAVSLLIAVAVHLAACTEDVSVLSPTSGSSSSGAGDDEGGPHGDCQTDADCGGKPCVPLTKGGYKVCLSFPVEATICPTGGAGDECCASADCATTNAGACYSGADLQYCGQWFPSALNRCVKDACQSDDDCSSPLSSAPGICAPAGAFGHPKRACLTALCHTDADCTAKAGGACLLIGNHDCCTLPAPEGLGCAYPGDCVHDADCPSGSCTLAKADGPVCTRVEACLF